MYSVIEFTIKTLINIENLSIKILISIDIKNDSVLRPQNLIKKKFVASIPGT